MFREPDSALTQGDGMGEHATDARERRTRERHDGVMDRVEDLVGQAQRAVAKGFVEQIIGSGDRANE